MQKRFSCFFLILLIIALGLLSRKLNAIPLWIGDVLYATMMFFIVRFILIHKRPLTVFLISLCICFCIELSQLYQANWINELRTTWPGRLILGRGFLWIDMAAYVLGAALGLTIDVFIKRRQSK